MISHGRGYWQRIRQNLRAGAYDVWGEAEGSRFVEPGGDEQGGEEGMEVLSPTSYRRLWKGWSPTLLRGALQKGKRQQSQVATREIPAVFLGKEVTELAVQPWKSCSRDSDLSDSGTVFRSQQDKAQSLLRNLGSLVCLEQWTEAEDLQRSIPTFVILGYAESHEPMSNHQKARPWKTANAGDCIEAPVDSGMVLKCVEMPLTKAVLWGCELWYPWPA